MIMTNEKKVLLIAPMASVHKRFNNANIIALRKKGFEIHLMANFDDGVGSEKENSLFKKECQKNNIIVHSFPFVRSIGVKNFFLINNIIKVMKENNFDIVHAHTEGGGLLLRLVIFCSRKNYKSIYTPHGMSFYKGSSLFSQFIYKPIEKWICSKMDSNISINKEEYDILNKWNINTARYTHGIGVDLSKFSSYKSTIREELCIDNDSIIITNVGELNKNKNQILLIKALSKIKKENVCLLLCGVGELKEYLRQESIANGVSDKVIFLGYRNDINNILAGTDIFVFSSFHEGLPVAVMEAMASGLPVVCSKIRGNTDLIAQGIGGFLFDPNDVDSLTENIHSLISNKELRRKMGNYNKEKIRLYSIDNVERELEDIYE